MKTGPNGDMHNHSFNTITMPRWWSSSNQSLFQFEPLPIRASSDQNLFQLVEPFPIRAFSDQRLFLQNLFCLDHFHLEHVPVCGENRNIQFRVISIRVFSVQIIFQLYYFKVNQIRTSYIIIFSIRAFSNQVLFLQSIFQFEGKCKKNILEHFLLDSFPFRSFSLQIIFIQSLFQFAKKFPKIPIRALSIR